MNTPVVTVPPAPDEQESKLALLRLKHRILDVIPAGTLYLETLLKLSDLRWTEELPTAAITCGAAPNMLFNRGFVEANCPMDEDLMMLVLHELHHVLYGHHMLFPGAGMAHNIAFDAVINARLCRSWRSPRHARFFRRTYPKPGFPEILLCPPPSWPAKAGDHESRQEQARLLPELGQALMGRVLALRDRLYAQDNSVTYEDILKLLREKAVESKPLLLGSHGNSCGGQDPQQQEQGKNGENQEGAEAPPANENNPASDPFLVEIARQMDKNLDDAAGGKTGGPGGGLHDIHPSTRNPRKDFLHALRQLLIKAGVYRQRLSRHRKRVIVATTRDSVTVVPNWHDRTAVAREDLMQIAPLLFNHTVPDRRAASEPAGAAHVYLDVSGSMNADLPWILAALAPLEKDGLCRVFLFSTIVAPAPKKGLLKGALVTTGGTDIDCVLDHVIAIKPKERPRQVVVLTDGYFSVPASRLMDSFNKTCTVLHGAVTHNGATGPLTTMTNSVTVMPAYTQS